MHVGQQVYTKGELRMFQARLIKGAGEMDKQRVSVTNLEGEERKGS